MLGSVKDGLQEENQGLAVERRRRQAPAIAVCGSYLILTPDCSMASPKLQWVKTDKIKRTEWLAQLRAWP